MNKPEPACHVDLTGVPETMLWPLWNRAAEMQRQDRLIEDPMSADLARRIDYDFAASFGKPTVFHPIRARVCDDLIHTFLARTSGTPVVVALGEGLETQLWRIDHPRLRWISVDVPEAIGIRRTLLPSHPHASLVECSALDPAWMDAVPDDAPLFISASGLLMYFEEDQVRALLTRIARRFPGAEIFFDTITPYFSRKTVNGMKVTRHYTAPPMPWGITVDGLPAFIDSIPYLEPVSVQSYADPFPKRTRLYKLLSAVPPIRRLFAGGLVHAKSSLVPGQDDSA
ncbi:class I SAM-dependent methyltransferase [Eilatimonas milleporae]|uniref:Leucine carboxyl methyltransferase n=1 Tax=Eilatimonas milleporae TaxID=911205 RepID=A0A3M0C884_9PROT|nr:class I SAM-dependent methyltransferase [Eilatimonas milleporae]RMB04580.1 leucine carboxyl methyltransferase [Eilatimonas milleporae]